MKKIISVLLMLVLVSPVWAADEWLKTRPEATDTRVAWPTDNQANNAAIDRLLANYREGMTISYSSAAAVSVSAGEITCSDTAGDVRKMRKNPSATSVGWADIDTLAEGASETFYLFANCDADAATATFKISRSSTAPTGITYYKRIGSFYNDASSNITQIINDNLKQTRDKQSKTVGTTYQATTDGVVVGIANCAGSAASIGDMFGYSDNASTPTTLLGNDSCQYNNTNNYAGISFPVKAGDYYKVVGTSTYASPTFTAYFIPNY
jgi:hypothetical protein